jgi:hypothetical protein
MKKRKREDSTAFPSLTDCAAKVCRLDTTDQDTQKFRYPDQPLVNKTFQKYIVCNNTFTDAIILYEKEIFIARFFLIVTTGFGTNILGVSSS